MGFGKQAIALLIAVSVLGSLFEGYVGASEVPHKLGAIIVSPEEYTKLTGFKFVPVTEDVYKHLIEMAPSYPRTPPISKDALIGIAAPGPVPPDQLPSSVNNSLYLPPIGDQGHVGSCNAWASTYYVWTYMINWFRNNPHPNSGEVIMNPSFTYNIINDGTDSGSIPEDAMVLISTVGAVAWDDFPVNTEDPDNVDDWPVDWQWRKAILNRGVSDMYSSVWGGPLTTGIVYVVNLTNSTQFQYLKGLLAAGYIAETAIKVYSNFDYFDSSTNIYALNQYHGSYRGGHAVTIVGYDDNKATPDGNGAFLMVNSWGTDWGDHGYWWLTYQAARDPSHKLSHGLAYIFVPQEPQPYTPKVYASFKVTHSKRGEIIGGTYNPNTYYIIQWGGIELGAGTTSSPFWSRWFFNFYMGYYTSASDLANYQAHPFPDSPIVLDLSDSVPSLNSQVSSQYVPFFISLADKYGDGVTGTLDSFEVVVNSTYIHRIVRYSGLPAPIPEDGNWMTVSVNVPVVDYAGITPLPGEVLHTDWAYIEVGSLVNISSATLEVGENQYTIQSDSPTHFYYNLTGLDNGAYTYKVIVTFQNGNTVELPQRTFKVSTGELGVHLSADSSSWASSETVAPGDVTYVNGTFVWKNAAEGAASPFTGIHYHLTELEAKYDSESGMLLFKIGVTPLDNLGSIPASLLNVSFDVNDDSNWDYHAVVDLSKPGTKVGVANVLDVYDSDGANVANMDTVFIPVPSDSAVYLQIPGDILGVSGNSQIKVRVELYEHDEVYGPLDVLTTGNGETTATLDITQVPTFSSLLLVGLVLFAGVFLFRRM